MEIIDAENQVLGRLASTVAKELLNGKNIHIINAEKTLITGNPKYILEFYTQKTQRGDPYHGPFFPRTPNGMLKKTVKGMLPKNAKGRAALKKLMIHISVPAELQGKEFKKYKAAEKKIMPKSITLGGLSIKLGHKKMW
jgi:large subunit ribosomal protein L13